MVHEARGKQSPQNIILVQEKLITSIKNHKIKQGKICKQKSAWNSVNTYLPLTLIDPIKHQQPFPEDLEKHLSKIVQELPKQDKPQL